MPGGLRDDLLSIAAEKIYLPVWSSEILVEMERNLSQPRFGLTSDQVAYLFREMARAFPKAQVAGWSERMGWVPESVDAGDRHVVAAALAAQAKSIVTANVGHFAATELPDLVGIEIKRPDDFLVDQWTIAPRRAAHGVRKQIARLGRTAEEHVDWVSKRLPKYGELLALDIDRLRIDP